jgi:hypothetical protein
MQTSLALYEALIQANVPVAAARRVAESLERDMTSSLATKQDLQHTEQLMAARFDALEGRTSLVLQNLESRIVMKLGALMTLLFGFAGAAITLLGR